MKLKEKLSNEVMATVSEITLSDGIDITRLLHDITVDDKISLTEAISKTSSIMYMLDKVTKLERISGDRDLYGTGALTYSELEPLVDMIIEVNQSFLDRLTTQGINVQEIITKALLSQ